MKHSQLSKLFSASVLSVSLAALPSALPASATTTAPGTTTTAPTTTTTTQTDDGFDWGWLGLLGLIGLAGLAGRKSEPTRYRDPDTVGTTGTSTSTYREP